ncbi:MAG TPA: porin, partial [Burkholderiales bacterium]|nr:porin [Burkholderiales bacterium]
MRSLRSWALALVAFAALSLPAPSLFAQTTDDDLRKEIQDLRQKLEQLEKKLEEQPAATAPQPASPSAREQALQQKVDDLDQQVRIFGRKQELAQEETAAEKEKNKSAGVVVAGPEGFGIRSADNAFRLNLKGVIQVDARFYDGTRLSSPPVPGAQTPDTFLLRRVRPVIEGTLYDKYDFRIMPDFGGGKQQLFDAYLQARFLPELQLRVGKYKSPFGLEQLQEDVNLTFAERSLATDLVPNRDVGAQLQGNLFDDTIAYQIGVFNGEPDGTTQADIDSNSGKDVEARVFARPFRNGSRASLRGLGVGVAYTTGRQTGSATS